MGIFIGILIGVVLARYVFPLFDSVLEMSQYKIGVKTAVNQANIQMIAYQLEKDCSEKAPLIGFNTEESISDFLRDDDEDEEDDEEEEMKAKVDASLKSDIDITGKIDMIPTGKIGFKI